MSVVDVDKSRLEDQDASVREGRKNRPSLGQLVIRSGPLIGILGLQAALSLTLNNTAFMDEALYLWAGRLELQHLLHGTPLHEGFAAYFSGSPLIYPPIGALFNAVGGLAAARGLSLAFMLGATWFVYDFGRRIVGKRAGLLGALVFAVTGPTIFLGHFATFDPMAVFLLALSMWLAVRGSFAKGTSAGVLIFLAGVVAAVAGMTKYAAFLFAPTIVMVVILAPPLRVRWWRRLIRGLAAIAGLAGGLAALAAVLGPSVMKGITSTTTNRPQGTASFMTVAGFTLRCVGPLIALTVIGALLERRRGYRSLAIILALTVFLAPVYQAHIHTTTALQKHLDYGALFAAPLAGLALARLLEWSRKEMTTVVVSLAVILGLAITGIATSREFFRVWNNSDQFVSVINSQFQPRVGRYLVDDDEVPEYYLESTSEPDQWFNTFFFQYTDPQTHQVLQGMPAYEDAISHRYFNLIVLTFTVTISKDQAIEQILNDSPNYQLISKAPYGYHHLVYIWRSTSP